MQNYTKILKCKLLYYKKNEFNILSRLSVKNDSSVMLFLTLGMRRKISGERFLKRPEKIKKRPERLTNLSGRFFIFRRQIFLPPNKLVYNPL